MLYGGRNDNKRKYPAFHYNKLGQTVTLNLQNSNAFQHMMTPFMKQLRFFESNSFDNAGFSQQLTTNDIWQTSRNSTDIYIFLKPAHYGISRYADAQPHGWHARKLPQRGNP